VTHVTHIAWPILDALCETPIARPHEDHSYCAHPHSHDRRCTFPMLLCGCRQRLEETGTISGEIDVHPECIAVRNAVKFNRYSRPSS